MEQTFEQTITVVVPTINATGATGGTGGTLASTGAPLVLIAGLALLLVVVAIAF
jgi:hypothetical protein